jgi:hypothetical protein
MDGSCEADPDDGTEGPGLSTDHARRAPNIPIRLS